MNNMILGYELIEVESMFDMIEVQCKKHKRHRINKKWAKRFGTKMIQVPKQDAYLVGNTFYAHPETMKRIKRALRKGEEDFENRILYGSSNINEVMPKPIFKETMLSVKEQKRMNKIMNEYKMHMNAYCGVPENLLEPKTIIGADYGNVIDSSVLIPIKSKDLKEDQGGSNMNKHCKKSLNENKYCFHAGEAYCNLYGAPKEEVTLNCEASLHIPESVEGKTDPEQTQEVEAMPKKTLWQRIKEKIVSIFTV